MSLDVYLTQPGAENVDPEREAIFVREDGQTCEITREEWDRRHPDREPISVMVGGESDGGNVFSRNITHNLGAMADAAGIYDALWHPENIEATTAKQLVQPLKDGLARLQSNAERFQRLNPANGWGDYEGLLKFVAAYLEACIRYPNAEVSVSR